ncbi:MAG: hypothetical protein KC550_02940 [Nanoarchaeota archaeon]|nr:hypothetical protein [Nanoarchaeota archaeon]
MNSNFDINGDEAILRINKNIYPKEVLSQTTYVMLDNFYFLIDEDDKYWLVSMKLKENKNIRNKQNNENKQNNNQINNNNKSNDVNSDLNKAVYDFFDELIESQSYLNQLKRTSKIRETILEKALLSQTLDNELIDELEKDNIKE